VINCRLSVLLISDVSIKLKYISKGKGVPMDTMKTWENCGHIRQVDSFLSRLFYSHWKSPSYRLNMKMSGS